MRVFDVLDIMSGCCHDVPSILNLLLLVIVELSPVLKIVVEIIVVFVNL